MAVREKENRALPPQPMPEETSTVEAEREIDLMELLYRLLKRTPYILLAGVLCALVAGLYSFYLATPLYQATAKLYVVSSKDSALNLSDLQIGTYLTSDYQEVFKTWEVHEEVLQNLALPYTYEELSRMLSVSNPGNTRILNITITSKSPDEATKVANEYANVAKRYISGTMSTDEPTTFSVALRPTQPSSPNKAQNILLGFVLGAFLTIGVITVFFVLDDKIKTADDIEKYARMATLATVPVMRGGATGGRKSATPSHGKGAAR